MLHGPAKAVGQEVYKSIIAQPVAQESQTEIGSPLEAPTPGKWLDPSLSAQPLPQPITGQSVAGQPGPEHVESFPPEYAGPPASYPPEGYPGQPGPGGILGFFRLPDGRYRGPGDPLLQESWLFRPYSVGGFLGYMQGSSPLVKDWVRQGGGAIGGVSAGWDYTYYFGAEMRFGVAASAIYDDPYAIDVLTARGGTEGPSPASGRLANYYLWDTSLLYYPWGDSAWRPYFLVGAGLSNITFLDALGDRWAQTLFTVPVGIGLKYRLGDFWAMRMEVADNVIFGNDHSIDLLNNVSVIAGVEFHFGGPRRTYWPWSPSETGW